MVGHHTVRDILFAIGIGVGGVGRGLDQRPHHVDVVIVMLALHHGGNPLEPHACVDRRLWKADALVRQLFELHEDKIPDFYEAVAILVRRAWRAARNMVAMIVEDFRTGAARAGIAHRPEIV